MQNAANCVGKCVHPNTVVEIKNKNFSAVAWHGLQLHEAGSEKHSLFSTVYN